MKKNDVFKTCLVDGREFKLFDLAKYRGNILRDTDGNIEVIYEDVSLIYNITTDDFLLDEGSIYTLILLNDWDKLDVEKRNYYLRKLEECVFPYGESLTSKDYVDINSLKLVSRTKNEGQYIDDEMNAELESLHLKRR